MEHLSWSPSEKRLAREVFEPAATAEEAQLLREFKQKVATIAEIQDLWALRRTLEQSEREFQSKYDYRYSQLLFLLGRLVREGRVQELELQGLSEQKLEYIRRIATL
jgi:steroid 5-alpha reductase family enzyme